MANETSKPGSGSANPEFSDILLQRNFDDPTEIKKKETGRKLAERIYKAEGMNTLNAYGGRYVRWAENDAWAKGKPPMKEFVDFTDIGGEGKTAWVNIDYKEQMKGAELCETLVTYLSSNDEYPCVTAIDDLSKKEKHDSKASALFRMNQISVIADLQEKFGVQLEPENAFVPNSQIEADLKFELDFQLEKEIDFEKKLSNVLDDNDYPILKRRLYRDLVVYNFGCLKVEKLHDNFVYLRKCVAKNMIYNYITNDNGKLELSYIGEKYSIKIIDLRTRFGKTKDRPTGLTEKEIFDFGKTATMGTNNNFYWQWSEVYSSQLQRPYDDYSIDIFDFEIRVPDLGYYTNKVDSFGKDNIEMKKGKPNPQNENTSVIVSDKIITMRGVYAVNCNKMIYWGLPDVVIKPYMNISKSLFSYTPIIPNNDGEYIPSIFERCIEPLREYVLCKLKRKQLIAEMRPPSVSVDIAGIRDLDLGNGNTIPAHEVIRAAKQTGFQLWDSTGMNPEDKNRNPFAPAANIEGVQQLAMLYQNIATCEAEMRSLLGVSIYLQGQQVGDRTANKLVETQIQSSNNVFGFLQTGFSQVMSEVLNKVCMMKWDEEFITNKRNDLMNTIFNVKVEMKITAYEKQELEKKIEFAMANQLIKFSDGVRVREIKNYKLASSYLAFMEDETFREAEEAKREAEKSNMISQQKSNEQAANKAIQLQKDKLKYDERIRELEGRNKKEEILLDKGLEIWKTLLTPQKSTGESGAATTMPKPELPPELAQLLNLTFQSVAQSLTVEMAKSEEQLQEEAAEKEQMMQAAAEQQAMEEQQGGQQPQMQQQVA